MNERMKRPINGLMMLLGGGMLGAGIGLLFAPCSGAKSRKKMIKMGRTVSDRSDRLMRDISGRMEDLADTMASMSGKASKMMHLR